MKSTLWVMLLLIGSNTFMTLAWYGHLRFKAVPLGLAIVISWLIALPEYALQVPANRLGYGRFTATQLKIFQEAISLSVFAIFAIFYFREVPTWRSGLAFLLIIAAVALVGRPQAEPANPDRVEPAVMASPPEGSVNS
jgi:uncharacterized protein (DUF486 family)